MAAINLVAHVVSRSYPLLSDKFGLAITATDSRGEAVTKLSEGDFTFTLGLVEPDELGEVFGPSSDEDTTRRTDSILTKALVQVIYSGNVKPVLNPDGNPAMVNVPVISFDPGSGQPVEKAIPVTTRDPGPARTLGEVPGCYMLQLQTKWQGKARVVLHISVRHGENHGQTCIPIEFA